MRTVIYKDKKIPEAEYRSLLADYTKYLEDNAGLKPIFWTVEWNFTDYPTEIDTDGDDVMRPTFMKELSEMVELHYGKYGTDNIVTLIHEDNWKSGRTATRKGIWGTNYSYSYGPYHFQYCRWDKKNPANTFGTLNHEQDHSYDSLIKVELGVNINPLLGVSHYDKEVTHGGTAPYKYIKYQENKEKLKVIAPYLQTAYAKRAERHVEAINGLQTTIISLLEKVVYYLKAKKNKKVGNPTT